MRSTKSSSSILRKFLIFNLLTFLILGLFTFWYLIGIKPNLVDQRTEKHIVIINNTSNHIERLKINFNKEGLQNFLLSTRFLFQNLERVQFYNLDGSIIADTNMLDLDQDVFRRTETVLEERIDESDVKSLNSRSSENILADSNEIKSLKKKMVEKKKNQPMIYEFK